MTLCNSFLIHDKAKAVIVMDTMWRTVDELSKGYVSKILLDDTRNVLWFGTGDFRLISSTHRAFQTLLALYCYPSFDDIISIIPLVISSLAKSLNISDYNTLYVCGFSNTKNLCLFSYKHATGWNLVQIESFMKPVEEGLTPKVLEMYTNAVNGYQDGNDEPMFELAKFQRNEQLQKRQKGIPEVHIGGNIEIVELLQTGITCPRIIGSFTEDQDKEFMKIS